MSCSRIALGGDYTNGAGFNANGIEAARGGKSLIVVKSNTGELFDVDAATGVAERIAVTGGDGELINADGLLRKGRKLYVVENRDDADPAAPGVGVISVVKLSRDLGRGVIARTITDPRFDVPTTIAALGRPQLRRQREVQHRPDPDHAVRGGEGPEEVGPATYSISRRSTAQRESSWRLESWSLRSTADTCASTVLDEIPRRRAISL